MKLKYDEVVSSFAFNFNLRRYTMVTLPEGLEKTIRKISFDTPEGVSQAVKAVEELCAFKLRLRGRSLHSSTFQLNVSAFREIRGAFRGCLGGV